MQVNINDKLINENPTIDIAQISLEDYSQLMIALDYRLETLEEKLKDYRDSDNERLKDFKTNIEEKILQLKKLIQEIKIK